MTRWISTPTDGEMNAPFTVPPRNLGAEISPDNSWIFIQGVETLPVRIVRHSENA